MPLAIGRASITTTERYDNQRLENLQIAAATLERGLTFESPLPEPAASAPDARKSHSQRSSRPFRLKAEATSARTELQESFKYEVRSPDAHRAGGDSDGV
jgi:hypothetical protein